MASEDKPAAPGSGPNAELRAAIAVLNEMVAKGELTAEDAMVAVSVGCGAVKMLKETRKLCVPTDDVIMWLGQWRDSLPGQAVDDLQAICRRYGYKHF